MRIGIAFDLVPDIRPDDGPDDRYEEFDKPATIETLANLFEEDGHEVALLRDGRALLVNVLDDRPDFVWNMAEGEGVGRCREARVPAVLEMLGIPHNGSDPLTLALCLDKTLAKVVVASTQRIRVPHGWSVPACDDPSHLEDLFLTYFRGVSAPTTVILKPAYEGSSKGIRANCLADNAADAAALCEQLLRDYQQPILVEEFITGDDVTVGVIGNGPRTEILGAMRIAPNPPDARFVYSARAEARLGRHDPPRNPRAVDGGGRTAAVRSGARRLPGPRVPRRGPD